MKQMGRVWVLIKKTRNGFGYYANPTRTRLEYIYNIKKKFKNSNPKYKYLLNFLSSPSSLTHTAAYPSSSLGSFTHTVTSNQAQLSTLLTPFRPRRSHIVAQPSAPLICLAHLPYPSPISHPANQPPSHGFTQPPPLGPHLVTLSRPHGLTSPRSPFFFFLLGLVRLNHVSLCLYLLFLCLCL